MPLTCLRGLYCLQLGLISAVIYRLLQLDSSVHLKAVLQRMWQLFTVGNEASRNTKAKQCHFWAASVIAIGVSPLTIAYSVIHWHIFLCVWRSQQKSVTLVVSEGKLNWSGIKCHSTLMMVNFDTLIKCKVNEQTKLFKELTNRNWSKSLCYLYFFQFFNFF